MRYLSYVLMLFIPVALIVAARSDQAADSQSLSSRRAQFSQLLADEWEYEMRESPEYATQVGDNRYDDRWSDLSIEHQLQLRKDAEQWLARFQAVDTTGFSEQEKLSAQLMIRSKKNQIEGIDLKTFEMPIDQFKGVHLGLAQLVDAILAAVNEQVRPAYTKLANFIATEYAPHGRTDPGVWALPNGDALYRYNIRVLSTTNMDPEQIHQIGLQEVARIEGEELAIAKKLGFSDLKGFRASLKKDPKVFATSADGILGKYKGYIDQMRPELPKLFGLLPKTPVEVQAMQAYRAADAAGADYQQGTPDGSRHAVVWVNTSDYQHRE